MNDTEWANYLESLDAHDRSLVEAILLRIGPEIERIEQAIVAIRVDVGVAERRSAGNSGRVTEAHGRVDKLSDRVHTIEDLREPGGSLAQLEAAVWALAIDVEALKQAKAAGDGT